MASKVADPAGFGEGKEGALEYATFEDYLDSQITETDMYYLEDEELARDLVELGYNGNGETLKRDEFDVRKQAERDKHLQKDKVPNEYASMGKDLSAYPFLHALANREELVRKGKVTVGACLRLQLDLFNVLLVHCIYSRREYKRARGFRIY